jgi:hypothetical protein
MFVQQRLASPTDDFGGRRAKRSRLPAVVELQNQIEYRRISPVRTIAHRKTSNRTIISKSKPPPIYILDSLWLPALYME